MNAAGTNKKIWGLIYYNPEDPRTWVEMSVGYGWTLNFARAEAAVYLVAMMAIGSVPPIAMALAAAASAGDFEAFSSVAWFFALACAANFLAYSLNFSGALSLFAYWRLAVLGTVGVLLGFALQSLLNGAYVWLVLEGEISWRDHLFLGPVAALSQSTGKWVVLQLLLRTQGASLFLSSALLCGLGFSLTELYLISLSDLAKAEVVVPLSWAVLERLSSAFFHIYSSALLAAAILYRRWIYALIVLIIHATTDFLAGLYLTTQFVGLPTFEVIVLLSSLATWGVFLLARRVERVRNSLRAAAN